jgi:hypothetical protein
VAQQQQEEEERRSRSRRRMKHFTENPYFTTEIKFLNKNFIIIINQSKNNYILT